MTKKEELMKVLLEDKFNQQLIGLHVESTGQTQFEIAEIAAQSVVNDYPAIANVIELQDKAVEHLFGQLGYVKN